MEDTPEIRIIEFDRENQNGRIYIRTEINEFTHDIPVVTECLEEVADGVPIKKIGATAKPIIKDDGIYIKLEMLSNTTAGQKLIDLLTDGFQLVSAGTGMVDDRTVKDYRLTYIFPVEPKKNAWNK